MERVVLVGILEVSVLESVMGGSQLKDSTDRRTADRTLTVAFYCTGG